MINSGIIASGKNEASLKQEARMYRPQAEGRNWLLPEGSDPRQSERGKVPVGTFYESIVRPLETLENMPKDNLGAEESRIVLDVGGGLLMWERMSPHRSAVDEATYQNLKERIGIQRIRCGFEDAGIPGDAKPELPRLTIVR